MRIDFYPAGEDCLLILTGLGGDTKGYSDKYVKIAENVVKKYNFSVAVAGVPRDLWDRHKEVFCEAVNGVYSGVNPKKLYIFGNSAGGTIAIWYAYLFPQIDRVLAVNPVLNLNYHNAKDGAEKFAGSCMHIVCGEYDSSATWQQLIPEKNNVKRHILRGVDHLFSEKTDEFISLPELLFTN